MLINSIWLILFQTNTLWGFGLGLLDIIAMLASNLYMMRSSTTDFVNTTEWIGMRGGFSIYAGWVTAATILNVTYFLKKAGLVDGAIPYNITEEQITVAIIWVALVIYNLRAYWDRNPLYGSVFIWVILAIRNNIINNKSQYTLISESATWIAIIHGISMTGLWTWVFAEEYYNVDLPENWDTGIFYNESMWDFV